jgi:hypothetical protein
MRALSFHRSMPILLLATLFSIGGWTSCDDGEVISSKGVPTGETEASISVTSSTPGRTAVSVRLEREEEHSTNPIKLGGGESFVASFQGRRQRLRSQGSEAKPAYGTVFETPVAEGPVSVRFRRNDYADVNGLEIMLPAPLDVREPVEGQVLDFADLLPLTWSPGEPGRVVSIWLRIACMEVDTGAPRMRSFRLQVDDDGVHDYDLGQLREATDPGIDRSRGCTLEADFQRFRASGLAPPFAPGSRITALQRSVVSGVQIVE